MKRLILEEPDTVEELIRHNLCAVVTRAEDQRLVRDGHPDPFDPWLRYRGTGIRFIENPAWSKEERSALVRHGLLAETSQF